MERLKDILNNDNLLLQKVGLVLGALGGLLVGMVISKKADDFDYIPSHEIMEEETGGTQDD